MDIWKIFLHLIEVYISIICWWFGIHESSLQEHESRLHEVFGSLQKVGFASMEENVHLR